MIYLGFTVLTEDPNRRDAVDRKYERSKYRIDSGTGPFTEIDKSGISRPVRPFNWFMEDRTAIGNFKAFMAERIGRLVPFWAPTWHNDLRLSADLLVPAASFDVENTGYSRYQFDPVKTYRRYVAFIQIGVGVQYIRKITNAVENTDTETLTFDAAPLTALLRDQWMLSFLTFCRLESDQYKIHYHTRTVAECQFDIREIPIETP
jgi:hypothetical protein